MALLVFFVRKKRKARNPGSQAYYEKPELGTDQGFTILPRHELPAIERQELEVEGVRHETGVGLPHEMPVPRVVHELADTG